MTHRSRLAPALLLVALATTGLAACGGSDDDDAGDDTSTEVTEAAGTDETTTAPVDEEADDESGDIDTGGDAGVGASTSAADCTATGQVSGGITADLADAEVVVNPGIDDSQALYDVTLPDGEVITFFAFADQAGNAVINTAEESTWSDFASEGIQLGADLSGGSFDITMSGFDVDANAIDDVTVTGEISCS